MIVLSSPQCQMAGALMHHTVFASLAATAVVAASISLVSERASAAACPVSHDALEKTLKASVKASGGPTNGGLDNNEWAAVVDRNGVVCAITFSGGKADDQWPGSR